MHKKNSLEKNKLTFLTLVLTGIFLILTGTPLAGTSISTFDSNTYPYLSLGAPLIVLGLIMISISAVQKISQLKAQVVIGVCGQVLFALIIFVIPSLPSFPYFTTFNFHSYSIVLGLLGIALSLESIIMLSGTQRIQERIKNINGDFSF